jgi:hypothetical protein
VASRTTELQRLLASIYTTFQKLDDPATNKICRHDFVFHMTDWEEDLRALAELCEYPEQFRRPEASRIVAGFLYHATAHIMEAARLLLDYEPGYLFSSPKPKRAEAPVRPAKE